MLLGREGVTGNEAKTFVEEIQRAQWQLACLVQTWLQEPHVCRPSLVVLNRGD